MMMWRPAAIARKQSSWHINVRCAWLRASLLGVFGVLAIAMSPAHGQPLDIVAAENFYGDIARQIGGRQVAVTSILNNPDQDPHEFEARPSTARALASAALVIYNGI